MEPVESFSANNKKSNILLKRFKIANVLLNKLASELYDYRVMKVTFIISQK